MCNRRNFDKCFISVFYHAPPLVVGGITFTGCPPVREVSGHYFGKEWPQIWNARVSWSSSDLIRFWLWPLDFPPFGVILICEMRQMLFSQWLSWEWLQWITTLIAWWCIGPEKQIRRVYTIKSHGKVSVGVGDVTLPTLCVEFCLVYIQILYFQGYRFTYWAEAFLTNRYQLSL